MMTKKRKHLVSLDNVVAKRLDAIAEPYGLTKNALISVLGYELSRINQNNLWHALGRIAEGETALIDDQPAKLKGRTRQALPV